jgi:hypothetical protein
MNIFICDALKAGKLFIVSESIFFTVAISPRRQLGPA